MAAGLGFKDFTTGEVLTAADVDGYLMQGVWVFASAAARDAAVTSPQEGNFAYLKDTNVTTYYTGSAWANLDTTGMTNPMTTTGDTIYSSSGSTPARLGIGTAGQVLTVNSGATAPEWKTPAGGGGMTLINTGNTSLAGVQTLSIATIPGTYKHLYIVGLGIRTTNSYGANLWCRVNGTTSTSYYNMRYQVVANAIYGDNGMTNTSYWFVSEINNGTGYKGVTNFEMSIPLYAGTTQLKVAETFSNRGTDDIQSQIRGTFNSTNAITDLEFFTSNSSTGNFTGDSAIYVYGVN